MSYVARALGFDGKTLRVLSKDSFERGVSLTVMASMLPKPVPMRVTSVTRSADQPGYFIVELHPVVPVKFTIGQTTLGPLEMAAAVLAARLSAAGPGITVEQALAMLDPGERGPCIKAAAAAVLLLLQSKGVLDPVPLLFSVKERK